MRLKYSNPMYLDDVAIDFPDMPIVMAHHYFPWQEEALAVAVHKPNVWIDLSGWRPRYLPPILVQYANTLLKERMLFGSDRPMITPEGWIEGFADLPIWDAVRPKILKENAMRLLGLPSADERRKTHDPLRSTRRDHPLFAAACRRGRANSSLGRRSRAGGYQAVFPTGRGCRRARG
ncbi:hypothetical protein FHT70_003669 [Rhizobium sp. BK049]|nr:hypothetical protein [Rhizobium sp. BK049]